MGGKFRGNLNCGNDLDRLSGNPGCYLFTYPLLNQKLKEILLRNDLKF